MARVRPLLEIIDAIVEFRTGRSTPPLRAVDGVSIELARGASLGIVGESGSGKSTLARAVVGLQPLTDGAIVFDNRELPAVRPVATRRRIQMVFQDPGSSLNPALKVGTVLDELLRGHHPDRDDRRARAAELMELVGLSTSVLERKPRSLSGGQRQRVGIARALATNPELLVADEPTSALDVSAQAVVLNLLRDLQRSLGLGLILISHDLAVVRNICSHVAVMRHGRVLEARPTPELFTDPQHPYTRNLLAASPDLHAFRHAATPAGVV